MSAEIRFVRQRSRFHGYGCVGRRYTIQKDDSGARWNLFVETSNGTSLIGGGYRTASAAKLAANTAETIWQINDPVR